VTTNMVFIIVGSALLALADRPSRYWSIVFPAFVIGASGDALLGAHVNISIFKIAPASQSGIVGAILNSALQLGSAIGSAATTAIQANVNNRQPDPVKSFKGHAAVFWFLLGLIVVEMIGFWVFFKESSAPASEESHPESGSYEPSPEDSQEPNSMKSTEVN
jgi:hypothetical protein